MSQSSSSSSTKRSNGRPSGSSAHLPGFSGKRDVLGPSRSRSDKDKERKPRKQGLKRKASSSSLAAGEAQSARSSKKPKDEAKSGSNTDTVAFNVKQENSDETNRLEKALHPSENDETKPLVDEPMKEAESEELELAANEEPARLATLNDLPVEVSGYEVVCRLRL